MSETPSDYSDGSRAPYVIFFICAVVAGFLAGVAGHGDLAVGMAVFFGLAATVFPLLMVLDRRRN